MIADVVLLTYRYNKPSHAVTFIDSSGIGSPISETDIRPALMDDMKLWFLGKDVALGIKRGGF
jgi:hypothetical protein